jgi:hypothetical protein
MEHVAAEFRRVEGALDELLKKEGARQARRD